MNGTRIIRCLALPLALLGGGLAGCDPAVTGDVATLPTLAPTAVAPEVDLSDAPAGTGTFSDVSVYEAAMRAGYEGDLDAFAGATRYLLDVEISPPPYVVVGQEKVHYINATGDTLDEIVFRLYPNHLAGRGTMQVESVAVDGQPVQPALSGEDTVLTVPLPGPLAPGEQTDVSMLFGLSLAPNEAPDIYGRFSDLDGVLSLPSFFPLLSVYDAESGDWWRELPSLQGDPVYSESGLFEVRLTVLDDAVVATVGQTIDQSDNGDGTTTHHIVTGPVRDFAVYLSEDYELVSGSSDGVTVNVFSLPGDEPDDTYVLNTTLGSVEVFNREFGEYPYAELDVVETPTLASGIEYPGVYVLADNIWNQEDSYSAVVIAHETAHQWWYSLVGNDQVGQPWLDEGMAQYAVEVFFRETVGDTQAQGTRNFYFEEVDSYLEEGGPDMPVGLPVDAYSEEAYRLFVYFKAPLFFDLLEEMYGQDDMRAFLHDYFETYKYGLASTDGLLSVAEETFGEDLDPLFDDWVR